MTVRRVFVTFTFEGVHRWPDAPLDSGVAFLRWAHRHRFHVRVDVAVGDGDREIEFLLLQRALVADVATQQRVQPQIVETWSCETWATWLAGRVPRHVGPRWRAVSVSEDGENGAWVALDD